MAFPETILPLQVDLSLDGTTWTDVTSDVRGDDQIRITRGRSDWGQQVDAGRCSLTLSNTDGKYSPRNPESPYFGQIGRNTPVRVSVNTGSVALDLAGASGDLAFTADHATLDITGDIDIRFDATLLNWYLADRDLGQVDTSLRTELIGKFSTTGDQRSWILYTRHGYLALEWSEAGTSTVKSVTSTQQLAIPASGRLAVRVTLDVNNGASGHTAVFYTSDSISGTWTQLGDAVVGSGTTSIFASTATLRIGDATNITYDEAIGSVHAAQVRTGIGGTVVANPDFTAQTSGATSFVDSAGRTWQLNGTAAITNRKVRFVGEVASWTPRWDTGGHDVVTEVEAAGVMRRLAQGAVPAKSPMYREFTNPTRANIPAYWPMEDGSDATELASAFDGHAPIQLTGAVTPAGYSDWRASDALPTIDTGSMRVTVPTYTATSYLFVRFFAHVPAAGPVSTQRLISFTQSGTAITWSLYVSTGGGLDLRAYNNEGTQILASGFFAFNINDEKVSIGIELTQDGSDIDYTLFVYYIDDSSLSDAVASAIAGTLSGYTVGRATSVRFGQDGAMNGTAVGHLAIADSNTAFIGTVGALHGWEGETAAARIHRLGLEEDIAAFATAPGDETMGVQSRDTVLALMRNAGEVDEGILAEQRSILGIRHVQRTSLYNQPVTLTLDYTGDDGLVAPLGPVDDDQSVTNDVTVSRDGGSSARAVLETGALSTQSPPDGIGLYDVAYTLKLHDDTQPTHHAGWRLHIGTWDEIRTPQVTVNLANAPASIEAAAAVDVGSRIQITNPPVWLPPDTLDLLVQGYSEVLDQFTWTITYNCAPAGPFNVAWSGDDDNATVEREFVWGDTEGSELADGLDETDTAVHVLTTVEPRWTDDVGDTPFDLRVGGEVMTVTAPHSLINTNPFFTSATTGWTAQNGSIARSTAQVNPHPRAAASLLITPNGSSSFGGATCSAVSVLPGVQYTVSLWAYSPGGHSNLQPMVDWFNSGGTYISSGTASGTAVAAGVWTYLEATYTAPSTAATGLVWARHDGTPAASAVWYAWAVRITRTKSSWLHDTFPRTAASGWGTADTGQAWSTGGGTAADFSVTGGYGAHRLATVNASRRTFVDFAYSDFDVYVSMTTSATATGGFLSGGPTGRYVDSDNLYMARVEVSTANALTLTIRKRVAAVETSLGSYSLMDTYTAGTYVRVRFQTMGSTLRAKAWLASGLEPGPWQITVTDTDLTDSDFIGLRSISSSSNTNVNPEIRYDDFEVVNPQTLTVTRSQNGVVKTHAAEADVRLAFPTYSAL